MVENGTMEALNGTESADILKITKLNKMFTNVNALKDFSLYAVKDLTLTLFSDQIFVLLGQNGAGKSTFVSMLTKEIEPTSGTANAFGIDLLSDSDKNNLIQFCPQQNILIDKMTVTENLRFFCLMRAVDQPETEVNQIL